MSLTTDPNTPGSSTETARPSQRRTYWFTVAILALCATLRCAAAVTGTSSWAHAVLASDALIGSMTTVGSALTARRLRGLRARAWACLAFGSSCWTVGTALTLYINVTTGEGAASTSLSIAGFVLLVLCSVFGLALHPSSRAPMMSHRLRVLLDVAAIALTLLLIAESARVDVVLQRRGWHLADLAMVVFPLADLLLVAMMGALLAYGAGRDRPRQRWLLLAVLALACADALICGMSRTGSLAAVTISGPLWIVAFAGSAVAGRRRPDESAVRADGPAFWQAMPYALVTCAALALAGMSLLGEAVGKLPLLALAVLTLLPLARDRVLVHHNRWLAEQVAQGAERLRQAAVFDPLTRLPNRAGFITLLTDALATQAQMQTEAPLTVVALQPSRPDLLDSLHADEDDPTVSQLAARVQACVRPGDQLARIDRSTFAAAIADGQHDGIEFAHDVMLALESPVHTGRRQLHIGMAAGISTATGAPDTASTPVALLQQAAAALATVSGTPGALAVFDRRMLQDVAANLEMQQALAHSLRTQPSRIDVVFEPVIDLRSGRLAGLASRAVWSSAEYPDIGAGRLASLAHEIGQGDRLDEAVLNSAIARFVRWRTKWPTAVDALWVTVSAGTFTNPAFAYRLEQLLKESGIPAQALVLDLADKVTDHVSSHQTRDAVYALRSLGVRLAGADATSLIADTSDAGEKDLQPDADYFDISPVLVERCVTDPRACRLVQANVELASARDGLTAARLVTTVEQHETLRRLGCHLARGPLYGSALPAADAEVLIEAAANGTFCTPATHAARRSRSSLAWEGLRKVIDNLPIAAFACNTSATLVLAEGGLLRQLGITPEMLGRPGEAAIDNEAGEFESGVRRALAGAPSVTTVQIRGRWLQAHFNPGYDDDGTVTGAIGVAIDVTHRIEAEKALRNSEQRFRSIFANAPIGIAIVGPDGLIQQVNPALAAMLGRPPDALVGRDLPWHPDLDPGADAQFQAVCLGEASQYRAERAYAHADGSPVWTRVTVGPLAGGSAPGTVIALAEDIRQVKQLEVELRHAQKLEAVGMLAAGIAHEINTPVQFIGDNLTFVADTFTQLTPLLTAAQRLAEDHEGAPAGLAEMIDPADLALALEEVPEAVSQSLGGVERVASIVRAMRNFGHPDGRQPTSVDVNAAIRDTATVARNEYKYVADMQLDLGDIPPVLGYASEFHQVILNLIVNAAHAIGDVVAGTDRRGTIKIRSWGEDSFVNVTVGDDGSGMSAETRARIFEPFFTTKPVGKGTGQGLAIVYSVVVEKHGGTVEVDSSPGAGSTFTLRLPTEPRTSPGTTRGAATPHATGPAPPLPTFAASDSH